MAVVAAAVTFVLVPPVRRLAVRLGAVPAIRDRDVHTDPTPRLGGLAMYGGLVAGLVVASLVPHAGRALADPETAGGNTVVALIAGGGLITLLGFLDDWRGMDPFVKLAGQLGAGLVLATCGLALPWIPLPDSLGGSYSLDSLLSPAVTVLVVVVVINAINFVDGLDGLAAGIVGISALVTWAYSLVLSWDQQDSRINVTAAVTSVLIGVCAGFIPHNFHPARIFMGDTGAMLIGLVLASSMITIIPQIPSADSTALNRFPVLLPLLLPLAVMVLPLMDLLFAVVRRLSRGMSPFAPDRGHLHHRLLDIGHSHRRTVLIMYAWTFLFGAAVVGLSVTRVPFVFFPVTVALALGLLWHMASPRWRARRRLRTAAPPALASEPAPVPAPPVPPAHAVRQGGGPSRDEVVRQGGVAR
ncbi:undecaprenyl/decaprenyl-phosphate alpha-N-acetylglucosaminyl 1-phosphate transferase [Bailinhaonella thermotolerans]|uniref:Undecaprenyl/decaprenyl-phosphate alpha-N-acetylglucosaminyl 1-phosphate transferase n=2 Tax=Bailinhaonella thermotolerans TaxID=1070861 RepID=A0A3A4B9F0_9ACTN|nr:undecaprenyl/decaprenyl-phosphate alpha-N-acetylglucosaminyl 1-phosphate transferase [Bailinhaonella thermotolerans]